MGNIDKFDIAASRYDTAERIETAHIIADRIRRIVADGRGKKAIDYGCGTGLVGLRLLDVFDSVLFVDASANMIEQLRAKLKNMDANNADTLCCDFMAGCPQGLSADVILVVQVLLHEKDTAALLTRLKSVLPSGGQLIIVDFDKNDRIVSDEVHNGFVQQELKSMLSALGFSHVRSETFYHGEKMFMGQDATLSVLEGVKG